MRESDALRRYIEESRTTLFGADPFRERAFSDDEYAERLDAFRRMLGREHVDLAIVTSPDAMAWLHGFRSRWYRQHTATSLPPTQCTVVPAADDPMFMIEASYHVDLVRATSIIEDIRPMPTGDLTREPTLDDYVTFLVDEIGRHARGRSLVIGVERWSCIPSPAVAGRIEDALEAAGHRVVDVSVAVRVLRRIKSAAEITLLERAQLACDAGLLAVRDEVRPGTTELQAWSVFMRAVVAAGGEQAALHETVAAGPLMPNLHRLSSREPLRAGRVFHADAAASYLGYHARATRPYILGAAPAPLRELTRIAAGAHEVLREHGRAGTPWRDLVGALRKYFDATGIDGGAAGYEMGITVAPADWVNELVWSVDDPDIDGVIEAGTVTNFETWNVVALVDLVVFENSGPRILSAVPPDLLVAHG